MQLGTQMGAAKTGRERGQALRRWLDGLTAYRQTCARPLALSLCTFFFSFVTWFHIPSPFCVALIVAQRPQGLTAVFPLLGMLASLLLRALWGIELDLWQYAGCLCALVLLLGAKPKRDSALCLIAGACMLPRVLACAVGANLLQTGYALAAVPLAMGAAYWLTHALDVLQNANHVLTFRDKACATLLLMLLTSGCGYVRLGAVNLGQALSVVLTLMAAGAAGAVYGGLAGVLCGTSLMLGGHDGRVALSLALGGLLAGLWQRKRAGLPPCLLMLAGTLVTAYLEDAFFLPPVTAVVGCALFFPASALFGEKARSLMMAATPATPGMESAFAQFQLEKWEEALRAMEAALPEVSETGLTRDPADELGEVLCAGCAERKLCWEQSREKTAATLREILLVSGDGDAALGEHLQSLRGSGCIRLHAVPAAVTQVMAVRQALRADKAKAHFERAMTATHLSAFAEVIRRVRGLTCGETMGDLQAAYQINKALHDLRFPAALCYARRVDGHLQAALEAEPLSLGARQPDRLLARLAREAGLSLDVSAMVKNRIELEERPLYSVELGISTLCAKQQGSEKAVSGDCLTARQFRGGQYVLLLSDGMGHGDKAHTESDKTIELLMLCMEAGYTRRQAITAVNGMMLSAMDGERFATVDLFDLSLWTGEAHSEKLGACPSFLVRGNYLKQLDGASLPLGILEEAAPTSQTLRMHSGDILVVVSDGVTDAFADAKSLHQAILDSLYIQPQRMADALMRAALLSCGGVPRDDMTVVTLLLYDRQRSRTGES